MRTLAVHADPLYSGTTEAADVVVSQTALGYRYKDSVAIAHHQHMDREQLIDLILVASRLLDTWVVE